MDDNLAVPAAIVIVAYIILLTLATYVIKHTIRLAPLHGNTR